MKVEYSQEVLTWHWPFFPFPFCQSPVDLECPRCTPRGKEPKPTADPVSWNHSPPSPLHPRQAGPELAHSGPRRSSWLSKQSKKHPDKYLPPGQREAFRRGCQPKMGWPLVTSSGIQPIWKLVTRLGPWLEPRHGREGRRPSPRTSP